MPIVAHFYPNGEFSIGSDTSGSRTKKRNHKTSKNQLITNNQWKKEVLAYAGWTESLPFPSERLYLLAPGTQLCSRSGYHYWLEEGTPTKTVLRWEDSAGHSHTTTLLQSFTQVSYQWGLVPLVHHSVESCDTPRKSRKTLRGMTKRMARNIRNAVYLLERKHGKDNLSFLTLTLPNLSSESLNKCVVGWDKLVKHFFDWLRITLKRCNIEFEYVYCTEIQSKRLQSRKEYAPHLHVVFRGRNGRKCSWAVTPKKCRKAWKRAILSLVDEQFDDSALENLQRIKRSAARYLSKYISKGANVLPDTTDESYVTSLRTQWGGMARTVSRLLRAAITRLDSSGRFSQHLQCLIGSFSIFVEQGILKYCKRGFISLRKSQSNGYESGLFVYAGCLSVETYRGGLVLLIAAIESLIASRGY